MVPLVCTIFCRPTKAKACNLSPSVARTRSFISSYDALTSIGDNFRTRLERLAKTGPESPSDGRLDWSRSSRRWSDVRFPFLSVSVVISGVYPRRITPVSVGASECRGRFPRFLPRDEEETKGTPFPPTGVYTFVDVRPSRLAPSRRLSRGVFGWKTSFDVAKFNTERIVYAQRRTNNVTATACSFV